jgi:hypothetical protein
MPEVVELRLTIPAELGPETEVLAELRERVSQVETECVGRYPAGVSVAGRCAPALLGDRQNQPWSGLSRKRPDIGNPVEDLRDLTARLQKFPWIEPSCVVGAW